MGFFTAGAAKKTQSPRLPMRQDIAAKSHDGGDGRK
jgi:hypothetical protein